MADPTVGAFGVEVEALPEGWQPLEVVCVVKCLDAEGVVRLCSRYSSGLSGWEALGMMDLEHGAQRKLLIDCFDTGADDD